MALCVLNTVRMSTNARNHVICELGGKDQKQLYI